MNDRPIWERPGVWWIVLSVLVVIIAPFLVEIQAASIGSGLYAADCISIFAAIGLWLAFGNSRNRFAISAVLVPLSTLVMIWGQQNGIGWPWWIFWYCLFFYGSITAVAAIPLAILSVYCSGRLQHQSENHADVGMEALQFGIRHILLATTAVAIVATIIRISLPYLDDGNSVGSNQLLVALGLATTLGLCSAIAVWATLGEQAVLRTAVSLAVASFLAVANIVFLPGFIGTLYIGITLVVWLQITALMWALRYEGYRFVTSDR